MTVAAHLSSFYAAAPIVLWVEDVVTRDYLGQVWGDPPDVAFFVAGTSEAVRPVVGAARNEQVRHVFGLIDRDFRRTNWPTWGNPTTDCFVFRRHEIENYSLDAAAIHGCALHNRSRTLPEIETELTRLAAQQPAWLACRCVLTDLCRIVQGDFPGHPKLADVPGVGEAERHITTAAWYTQLAVRATACTTAGHVRTLLDAAALNFNTALADGSWVVEFSGKEIFRRIRDYVYAPGTRGSHDTDFAKAIGVWQRANGQVPQDLTDLLAALIARVRTP